MKFVIVFAVALVFTLPCVLGTGRIFKGKDAAKGKFPHQVRIELLLPKGLMTICGASLIAKNWVLTAAHCVGSGKGVTVYLANNRDFPSKKILIHSNYNDDTNENDIAVIEIPAVTLTKEVDIVQLPKMGASQSNYANEDVTVAGWGQMGNGGPLPKKLQWTTLKVLSNKDCQKIIPYHRVYDGMICATGVDSSGACNGDSGGPLVLIKTNTQVGIASWISVRGCEQGLPVGFTRVTHYLPWIKEKTGVFY